MLLPSNSLLGEPLSPQLSSRTLLRSFDYRGVRLLPSRFQQQAEFARQFYGNMSNEDMLKGFRRDAGLAAPGNDMRGWCRKNCSATFGQWISGMARMGCAMNDTALRDKAVYLIEEWEKTLGPDSNPRMNTYAWEKMACGLVDLALYGDFPRAFELLERITVWASRNFDRSRSPANGKDRDGRRPHGTLEWYTLSENTFRAYAATGNKTFLAFAMVWLYPEYWDQFAKTNRPAGAAYRHSYSHMNTFCSAAMAYGVTADKHYLQIVKNAYDWATETQAFASGAYGPAEWSVPNDGTLGSSLDVRSDTAEVPCDSWAGFKMSRYLMNFTGEARYGDWIERLLYNGIGAALPIQPDGRSYYYADYRMGMGTKIFFWDEWPCCSGTYFQTIADYHNVIYFHDADGLYVNLAVPSEVTWQHGGQAVRLIQDTRFPDEEQTQFTFSLSSPAKFQLHVRVPRWCADGAITVNREPQKVSWVRGEWATVEREWKSGDSVTVNFPMRVVPSPVDTQHPNRIAVMYGPVLMAQSARFFNFPLSGASPEEVAASLKRGPDSGLKLLSTDDVSPEFARLDQHVGEMVPLYNFGEREPYRVYFDIHKPRVL